ncbi:glutamine synthetase family protein [Aestuariibius sp. 2305UL40-4]|uniref:glutamine synthetase family protein n=1 Tax=Aestuariibius violaceus TaxID=3234132 RepID=UPI00345E3DDC
MSWKDEVATFLKTHGEPDRVEVMLCDLNAVLRGKWVPGTALDKIGRGTVKLPVSTYAPNIFGEEVPESGLGIVQGDPDGALLPVPGTLAPIPGGGAQVLVEMAGEWASPRGRLADIVTRFADRGLTPCVALELEFHLLQPRTAPEDPPVPPEGAPQAQNYDMEVLDRTAPVLDAILEGAAAQGLTTETVIAEYGPGQFEVNFRHCADALHAADMAVLFRRLVRTVATSHDLEATFMAKPYADSPGNGLHAHVSLLNADGDNILATENGLSDPLGHAIAGSLATMADCQAIFAPHLNSYRRFQPMSFAPTAPDWGLDDRGAGVRVPTTSGRDARLEHRIAGADANPYLALAAILGGILWGLDQRLTPPAPRGETETPPLGDDWSAAIDRFATSDVTAWIFGDAYRDLYTAIRRNEIARLMPIIHPLEYATYLSRL